MRRLPAPWVFVATGIIFNILSAVITHYFIGINNSDIAEINRQADNKQVLIDSLWQSKTEIERKKELFILLLATLDTGRKDKTSQVIDQYYRGYINNIITTHALTEFETLAQSTMKNSKLILDVSEAAQASIIRNINATYLEKIELEDKKAPIDKQNARLFSIAIFLQIIGLILVLARDLSKA